MTDMFTREAKTKAGSALRSSRSTASTAMSAELLLPSTEASSLRATGITSKGALARDARRFAAIHSQAGNVTCME